jgi:hypothetical protein
MEEHKGLPFAILDIMKANALYIDKAAGRWMFAFRLPTVIANQHGGSRYGEGAPNKRARTRSWVSCLIGRRGWIVDVPEDFHARTPAKDI